MKATHEIKWMNELMDEWYGHRQLMRFVAYVAHVSTWHAWDVRLGNVVPSLGMGGCVQAYDHEVRSIEQPERLQGWRLQGRRLHSSRSESASSWPAVPSNSLMWHFRSSSSRQVTIHSLRSRCQQGQSDPGKYPRGSRHVSCVARGTLLPRSSIHQSFWSG